MDFHYTNLTSERLEDYIEFTQQIFPQRQHVAARLETQILDNPFLEDPDKLEILLTSDDAGTIVGQYGLTPYFYHSGGREQIGYSGFDFYVLEEYRQHGIGKKLAAMALDRAPFFGIGATPVAEHIYQKLGATTIGHMYRYFWLRSPLQSGYLAGQAVLKDRWFRKPHNVGNFALPDQISVDDAVFEYRTDASGWEDYAWSDDVISFSRPSKYLKWRFFDHPEHYRLYTLKDSSPNAYFVLRRYHWRELSLLCMVDYRMPEGDNRGFDNMLNAAKALARVGKFDGVVVFSSLHFVDDRLGTQGFRRIGQPTIVVVKGDLPLDETHIAERNSILVTLADCDQDFVIYD